jgi:hypothetical protein
VLVLASSRISFLLLKASPLNIVAMEEMGAVKATCFTFACTALLGSNYFIDFAQAMSSQSTTMSGGSETGTAGGSAAGGSVKGGPLQGGP